MKRTQTRKTKHADTNPDISQLRVSTPIPGPANPKRSRDTENSKNSILDSNVQRVKVSSFQKDGENVVVESSYNMNNSENGNSYKKRIQQAPAYINTNLMKIKMEVDYVPIVAVKSEPAEDQDLKQEMEEDKNDNDNGQMGSTSFYVESMESNASSRSAQNANEDNQEFQGLDPERRKQHQQEKVETEENTQISNARDQRENRTRENEKEAIIVKLKEEIKKYSRNVISLQRENTEIQRALQIQIDELKLVNEQKQTNINALNSVLAQQWTQINQLKSQVAEQQNQIEEMSKKLKPTATSENQQSVDKSNSNAGQVKIRDLPPKALSRIFDYLDLKSLKQSRLVCRLWRNEAGKILLSNFYLVCDDMQTCKKSLQNWLRNPYSMSSAKAGKLLSKDKNAQGTLQLLRKFKKVRNSITELVFYPKQPDTGNLYEILQLLPNLQVLETKVLDLSPQRKWLVSDPNKLQLLVQKLETLKKLKLNFCMTPDLAKYFLHHRQQFASIERLKIRVIGMNFMSSFMTHSLYNLKITRFTLGLQENYKVELIRRFLSQISASLQHLKFVVHTSQGNSLSRFQPWTDNWLIPLGLDRLETLEIEPTLLGEQLVLKSIVAALRLPRLRKLTVDSIPVDLEVVIFNWNSHEAAKGRKLASESLEELEISSPFVAEDNNSKLPRLPWPRLKSLKCSCEYSDIQSFDASFLSELRNLEWLDLVVSRNWTTDENTNKKNEADDSRSSQSAEFQLRDLKNLKRVCIRFWGNEKRYQDFAKSFVEKDFKFMKNLQSVRIRGVVIDAEPLKSVLGPNVSIIFTD